MDYYLIGGELYHHKYVKRERVNGQWRYWYDNPRNSRTVIKRMMDDSDERIKTRQLEERRAAQLAAVKDLAIPTKLTKKIMEAGVFDDMDDEDLIDVVIDVVSEVYPAMTRTEWKGLTKEQRHIIGSVAYISAAKKAGVDAVEYAKKDAADRKNKRKNMSGELEHSGVKGMKWGQRRYQNKDGSLTPEGRERYRKPKEDDPGCAGSGDEEKFFNTRGMSWGRINPIRRKMLETKAKSKAKASSDVESKPKTKTESETETEPKQVESKRKPVKKMTETELRERITRLELEKSYRKAKKESMSRGKAFVMDVLEQSGKNIAVQLTTYAMGTSVNAIAKASGYTNATRKTKKDDGTEIIEKIFEDIVNPRKGQKEK